MTLILLSMLLAINTDYEREVERWRAGAENSLRSETGWLTLAGLVWLEEGENRIAMPASAPDFGIFELRGRRVTLRPAGGGTAVEMKPDTSGNPTVIERGSYSVLIIERNGRMGIRIRDKNSKTRREFGGMKWYSIREGYRLVARWKPYDPPRTIAIANILGGVDQEKTPGRAVFKLSGKEYALEPLQSGEQLFFIFRDGTSGKETYAGGRFLYAEKPSGGSVVLDFNEAVNPPCAFTPYATCPLPPRQNRLSVRIEAGELGPGAH